MRTTSRAARRARKSPRESASPSALDQYLRETQRYPILAREEEVALARRIREGDAEALEALVNANLRFVVTVARQVQHRGVLLDDLVSEGNLGLVRAAERFDETRGVRFLSYAVWWIRQGIFEALRAQSSLVQTPAAATARRAGDAPSAAEWRERSLDAPVGAEDNTTLGELVADESAPAPDEIVQASDSRRVLLHALASLTAQDAQIVRLHFGLDARGPLAPKELGARLALTPARVRQRLAAALAQLRRSLDRRAVEAVA